MVQIDADRKSATQAEVVAKIWKQTEKHLDLGVGLGFSYTEKVKVKFSVQSKETGRHKTEILRNFKYSWRYFDSRALRIFNFIHCLM